MKEIKKEGWIVGVMALFFAVINRINQNAEINRIFVFTKPEMRWKYYVMTIVALAVSFLFFAFLIWIVFELGRWHHKKCEEFIRYFLVYYVIQLVILICIWPGNLKQDEAYLTGYAISNMLVYWYQSFFSQIFYITAFMIFPYVVSVTFFQVTIISLFAAGTMQKVADIFEKKGLQWFLMIPFLLLPVLDSNQFPLRSSMICWIYLFMMISLYTEYKKKGYIGEKCAYLITFLAVFTGVWRIEFLYMVPLIFLFIFFNQKKSSQEKKSFKIILKSLIIAGVGYFILTIPNRFFQSDDNYILTTIATPVTEILVTHQYDHDASLEDVFQAWDDFISIDVVKEDDFLGFDTPYIMSRQPALEKDHKMKCLLGGIRLCVYYWKEFLSNRYWVYAFANGFIPNTYNHGSALNVVIDGKDLFNEHFRYTSLGNPKLKAAVISFLACRENGNFQHTNFLYPILYNAAWPMILMLLFGVGFLVRKKFFNAAVCGTVLCQVVIIFLSAPAPYFMYYMPFYLTGYTLCVVFLLEWLDKKEN